MFSNNIILLDLDQFELAIGYMFWLKRWPVTVSYKELEEPSLSKKKKYKNGESLIRYPDPKQLP
jgi:hypothetical protein